MDQDGIDAQRQKRRRTSSVDRGGRAEELPQTGQRGGGEAGGVEEEELSGDDASLAGSDGMARERELDERALEDEMIDHDSGRSSEPVDDAEQAEYVNSLTLPRAALLPTSQEPGMVDWIGRFYRMYTR